MPYDAATPALEFGDRHRALIKRGEKLFERGDLPSLWQTIADQFYVERADFTLSRGWGDEFAAHLSTSYPLLVRRDLGDSMASMLRYGTDWFKTGVNREADQIDNAGQQWLEAATRTQFKAMYDPITQFTRATKQADHDYVTFGQPVISLEVNTAGSALLYRTWHLRDVAWCFNAEGRRELTVRRWKCPAIDCLRTFKRTCHPDVRKMVEDNDGAGAYQEVDLRHYVIMTDAYDPVQKRRNPMPFISIWIDLARNHLLQEQPIPTQHYIIPQWHRVDSSPYAVSPAVICALPDARLLQAITYTLLRAGEMAVDPAIMAKRDVVKSPLEIFPGGTTWVDLEEDQKLSEAMRPILNDTSGIPIGMNMQDRIMATLEKAFYLNRLTMPPVTHEMTAEESRIRYQEYIRTVQPLFAPVEAEYNAPLCEDSFVLLKMNGAFGPPQNVPESLGGSNVQFKFQSPLTAAEEGELARTFVETKGLLLEAAELDPAAPRMLKVQPAVRDALRGRKTPSKWLVSEDDMAEISEQNRQEMEATKAAGKIGQGAAVVEQVGKAGQAMQQAQQVPA